MTGPLEGIKVVELGVWVAGPAAGGIMADWGADVIKIEPPSGDPGRMFGRMLGCDLGVNPPFEMDNRSKRSIVLNLAGEAGRDIAFQLLADADVFVTNVRPGALQRLGLDFESVSKRAPRLVYGLIFLVLSVAGLFALVPLRGKNRGNQVADHGIVVDDEDPVFCRFRVWRGQEDSLSLQGIYL